MTGLTEAGTMKTVITKADNVQIGEEETPAATTQTGTVQTSINPSSKSQGRVSDESLQRRQLGVQPLQSSGSPTRE